jgi:hypothetical protein
MQKKMLPVLLVVSVCLVLSGLATAQAMKKLTVQVPFDFHMRSRYCAAGTYVVLREGPFLSLRDNKGRSLGISLARPSQDDAAPAESKLVFFEYHDVRVLTRILWQGEKSQYEFVPAGHEEEVARRITPNAVTSAEAGGKP